MKKELVVDSWLVLLENQTSHRESLVRDIVNRIQAYNIPDIKLDERDLAGTMIEGFRGKRRPYIVVKNDVFGGGLMVYIGVRVYGNLLAVSWYLTQRSRIRKRRALIGRRLMNPEDLSVFDQEELSYFTSAVHEAVKAAVKNLMESQHLDFSKVNTHTRGFLNLS